MKGGEIIKKIKRSSVSEQASYKGVCPQRAEAGPDAEARGPGAQRLQPHAPGQGEDGEDGASAGSHGGPWHRPGARRLPEPSVPQVQPSRQPAQVRVRREDQ